MPRNPASLARERREGACSATGLPLGEAITEIRFDPDGRLSLTWLKGPDRAPMSERVTVPSFAR